MAKPAKPGLADDAAPGDPSRPLLASVDAGKVVVVLFWNKNASDDRATRRGLRSIDLHGGKVVASAVPIGDVGRYEAITRGVQVLESPTVLVIGAGGKARAITGYTQAKEIDQAVSDIGGKGFEARKAFQHKGFAAVADDACKDFGYALEQKSNPPTTVAALSKALGTGAVELGHSRNRMVKAKATSADERKLKAALVAFADQDIKWVAEARASSRPAPSRAPSSSRSCSARATATTPTSRPPRSCTSAAATPASDRPERPAYTGRVPDERFEEHLLHPVGRGRVPVHDGAAGGAACGDLVRIGVAVDGDRVADAGFEASGCGAAIAAGSAAVELVRGAAVLDAARVGTHAISDALGGLSPGKLHAAELAADALARALGRAVADADAHPPSIPSARWWP